MLYTRKGDNGTTKIFDCDQRMSKSSKIAEALGDLDEANSFIGLIKAYIKEKGLTFLKIQGQTFEEILQKSQQNFFIVQAELAGVEDKTIKKEKIEEMEKIIDGIEKELPPIKTFFISGATELGALFDVSRTIVRRAERSVVAVSEEGKIKIGEHSLSYLNRLSSLLYAFARYSNFKLGGEEKAPDYK